MVGKPRPGQIVVVASGKGGVGKTNLLVNLGVRLSQQGVSTILLDSDVRHADTRILLNLALPEPTARWPAARRVTPAQLIDGPAGLRVVCSGPDRRGGWELPDCDPSSHAQPLRRLRNVCDILLVDCGTLANGAAASFALAGEQLILVTTPELTAVAAAYALLKLCHRRGFCARAGVVINMARRQAAAVAAARRLQRVAQRFLGLSLENLGYIPFDRHVMAAVRQRVPFVQRYPRCAASLGIDALARRLTSPFAARRTQLGLWSRVASLFF